MGLHGDALTGLTHAAPPATSAPAFYNITLIIRSQGGAACLIAYVAFSLPAMHAWRYNSLTIPTVRQINQLFHRETI